MKTIKREKNSIVGAFKEIYPDIEIKAPRWAEFGATQEFRKQKVGEIVLFPLSLYNYQTIRSTPSTTMLPERINEGREWATKVDHDNKSIAVLRYK